MDYGMTTEAAVALMLLLFKHNNITMATNS